MNIILGTLCIFVGFICTLGGTGTMEMSIDLSGFCLGLLTACLGLASFLSGVILLNLDKPKPMATRIK